MRVMPSPPERLETDHEKRAASKVRGVPQFLRISQMMVGCEGSNCFAVHFS